MSIISINVEEIGATGLFWLFFTYGFVLFQASNLISEGSDLLLLVPSLAGLVGGVVLPLLGAVPDAAIMLFSGLGDLDEAQKNLSVGVGALAGSTIMLLTISLSLSVFAGRVTLDGPDNMPNYRRKPKLDNKPFLQDLSTSGIVLTKEVNTGSKIMMLTSLSYLIIQIPASYLTSDDFRVVGAEEKRWALAGLIVCVVCFVSYLIVQYKMSSSGTRFSKMIFEMKKSLQEEKISLRACVYDFFVIRQDILNESIRNRDESEILIEKEVDENALKLMKNLLQGPFAKFDVDNSKTLDKAEIKNLFSDLNEKVDDAFVSDVLNAYDTNGDGLFSLGELTEALFTRLKEDFEHGDLVHSSEVEVGTGNDVNEEEEEEEEIPIEFVDLSPAEQQSAIKKRAFTMLFVGTTLVVLFSDPMVDVVSELAARINVSAFYVSFTLVPLASNASEVIASQFYARKKTSSSISVSLSALEGAAAMNNTFCLAIFMGLIYFRGLAWEFTAETIVIVAVQLIVGIAALKKKMTSLTAVLILTLFPLSIALVVLLEAIGFD